MERNRISNILQVALACALGLAACTPAAPRPPTEAELGPVPTAREKAQVTYAPQVPPPLARKTAAIVTVELDASVVRLPVQGDLEYDFWTFNGRTPGPFIRTRVGDVLELSLTNSDKSGMPHNIDLHAVTGPGGGATVTQVLPGEKKTATMRLMHPGLFVYHCAAPPVWGHIANGMYGLILVEPAAGLPKVDREYYVLQSEIYARDPEPGQSVLQYSNEDGLLEHPRNVVFNGRVGSLTGEGMLQARTGERVRIYFGNIGPNLISSFHVIGEIMDDVYREADLVSPPAHSVQTTLVPAGGAAVVDFQVDVPGNYILVDHAIFRLAKGASGILHVEGKDRPDLFHSDQPPAGGGDHKME